MLADFASPFHERHFHYEEHLERMKRRSSASVSDSSGFSDSESKCAPRGRCPAPRGSHPVRAGALGAVSVCLSVIGGVGPSEVTLPLRAVPRALGEWSRGAVAQRGQEPGGGSGGPVGLPEAGRCHGLEGFLKQLVRPQPDGTPGTRAFPQFPRLLSFPLPPPLSNTFQRMWSKWHRNGGGRGRGRA